MRNIFITSVFMIYATCLMGQVAINDINFPDANFRAIVTGNTIDTDNDDTLSTSEIAAVTSLDVNGFGKNNSQKIANLTGIEHFTALTRLVCNDNNNLTNLDVSKNTALTQLYCHINQLPSLDVSKNTALTSLDCSYNQLTSLDVSNNTALTSLNCSSNQLTGLDVSKNTALTDLFCFSNQLPSLDVSNSTALTILHCFSNQLPSLDVSSNTALKELHCDNNKLPSLDVSKNTALTVLWCHSNQLTSLDVSKNTALTTLLCYSNQLSSLDVSSNTALTTLLCYSNQLSSLDVSKNTVLTRLYCYTNRLASLDVTNNTVLTDLNCSSNQLPGLDVSNNTALTSLNCHTNQLTSLNVKNGNNANMTIFDARFNTNLTCIQVDDASAIPSSWTKDAGASYNTECKPLNIADNKTLSESISIYKVDNFRLRVVGLPIGNATVRIYNILGKEIINNSFSTIGLKDISLPPLSSGIYIVQIETKTGKLDRKVSF